MQTNQKFTREDREKIARGFSTSGKGQREYAREYGISDRSLRAWLRRYAQREDINPARLRSFLERWLLEGQRILRGMDAELGFRAEHQEELCTSSPGCSLSQTGEPARRDRLTPRLRSELPAETFSGDVRTLSLPPKLPDGESRPDDRDPRDVEQELPPKRALFNQVLNNPLQSALPVEVQSPVADGTQVKPAERFRWDL